QHPPARAARHLALSAVYAMVSEPVCSFIVGNQPRIMARTSNTCVPFHKKRTFSTVGNGVSGLVHIRSHQVFRAGHQHVVFTIGSLATAAFRTKEIIVIAPLMDHHSLKVAGSYFHFLR